jgi:hypothetical protein
VVSVCASIYSGRPCIACPADASFRRPLPVTCDVHRLSRSSGRPGRRSTECTQTGIRSHDGRIGRTTAPFDVTARQFGGTEDLPRDSDRSSGGRASIRGDRRSVDPDRTGIRVARGPICPAADASPASGSPSAAPRPHRSCPRPRSQRPARRHARPSRHFTGHCRHRPDRRRIGPAPSPSPVPLSAFTSAESGAGRTSSA